MNTTPCLPCRNAENSKQDFKREQDSEGILTGTKEKYETGIDITTKPREKKKKKREKKAPRKLRCDTKT